MVNTLLRRLSTTGDAQLFVVAFAIVSGLGGWLADTAPTGLVMWDNILTAAFAAVVAAAASAAKRWSWLPLGLAASILPGPSPAAVLGVAALGVIGHAWFSDGKRNRMAGAFVGATAMQSLLRADQQLFFGFNSLVVAAVTLLVLIAGYQTASRDVRRRTRRATLGLALIVLIAGLGAVGAIAAGRSTSERGISAARSGLSAARLGDQEASLNLLETAESSFDDASSTFSALYTKPALLVPVLAQHIRMLHVASREGRSIVSAARAVAIDADVSRLRASGGAIDLDLIGSMADRLGAANDELVTAEFEIDDVNTRWLAPPLRNSLGDFQAELGTARQEIDLADDALAAMPRLLGAEKPFRYFVMFATPAESRELGGFLGAYAVLEASQGTISLIEVGNNTALTPFSEPGQLNEPTLYPPWYTEYRLNKFPMNLPGTPDPLTVLAATSDLLPRVAGAPIDAMVYMDPFATEAFVGLVGQISVDGLAEPLTGTNTADFLLEGQYERYSDPSERKAFLVSMLEQTFTQLLGADLPGPETLGARLGPSARQGRLQIATFDSQVNGFLRRVFLLRDFPRPQGFDFLSVVQANGAPTKLDTYLTRDVDYSVRVLDIETGQMEATVTIDLAYEPPADAPEYVIGGTDPYSDWQGLPLDGSTRTLLSIYTPHELRTLRVNGEVTAASVQLEYGYWRHLTSIDLAPGERATVEFDVAGTINLSSGYWLTVANQPLVNDDVLTVTVAPPPGWNVGIGTAGEASQTSFVLSEDQQLGWALSRQQ